MLSVWLTTALLAQGPDERAVLRSHCPSLVSVPIHRGSHPAPLIDVEIAGKKRHMLVDTGASGSVVAQKFVDELHLKPFAHSQSEDPSGKNSVQVDLYRIPEVKIGGATFYGVLVFVLPKTLQSPSIDAVMQDGVLSYAIFRDQLLTFDFPRKTLTFGPGELPLSAAKFTMPTGTVAVDVAIGSLVVPCQIDTGAAGGLMVPSELRDRLPLDGEPKPAGKTSTLFNTMEVLEANLKGPVEVCGVRLDVPTVEMHAGFPVGNIGNGVLQNLVVTIDQRNQRVRLVKKERT
ncbi:MAG: retroviral-like aspartic protease family protein [Armatimonadetes bacterium]|nr:retroviral-like aspartic protease family protein [Armatimonadota bacterium]